MTDASLLKDPLSAHPFVATRRSVGSRDKADLATSLPPQTALTLDWLRKAFGDAVLVISLRQARGNASTPTYCNLPLSIVEGEIENQGDILEASTEAIDGKHGLMTPAAIHVSMSRDAMAVASLCRRSAAGIPTPYAVVVRHDGVLQGIVTLARYTPLSEGEQHVLQVFAPALLGFIAETPPRAMTATVSPRERECIAWAAHGKTAWEIGQIMSISEHTVVRHLHNAGLKLSTTNRQHTIAEAMRLKLIS